MDKFELIQKNYCTLDYNNFSYYCNTDSKDNITIPLSSIISLILENNSSDIKINYLNQKKKKKYLTIYFTSSNDANIFLDKFKTNDTSILLSENNRQLTKSEAFSEPLTVFFYLLLFIVIIGGSIAIIIWQFSAGADSVHIPIIFIPIFRLYEFFGLTKSIIFASIPLILCLIWGIIRVNNPPKIREILNATNNKDF